MFTDKEFSALAETYMDTIFRLAFHYLKNRSEADDVTQEVLLKLYCAKKPFESEAHIKHWLIRVTINACKKVLRSPWRRMEPIEDYAGTLVFPSREHSELFDSVMALPVKYRVPLYLHYYEDYSCEEIARFLGVPNATVRTRLRRARELLKNYLQEAKYHD